MWIRVPSPGESGGVPGLVVCPSWFQDSTAGVRLTVSRVDALTGDHERESPQDRVAVAGGQCSYHTGIERFQGRDGRQHLPRADPRPVPLASIIRQPLAGF
jgi:hypothetical protein